MYRLEWIEQLKLRRNGAAAVPTHTISPVVWSLGFTSLLTDISSEMVNSVLPAYLVLHLHLSPIQYGLIDGIYNGFAVALLSLLAGYFADRHTRQKEVALAGYGFSTACKLVLLAAGTTWTWVLAVVGIDRIGKGIRTAPRDALISLNTAPHSYATAFALHRGLDACGALLGPVIAFLLLARLPGAFDAIWITSFAFGVLGVSVLWLFVPKPTLAAAPAPAPRTAEVPRVWNALRSRRFVALTGCGALFALTTVSDGFLYLLLQEKTGVSSGFFPLFYVATAGAYMVSSLPMGRLADRIGRSTVFLSGYLWLGLLYALLLTHDTMGIPLLCAALLGLGLYYAATEGVLMALASSVIPDGRRTIGLAVVATAIACAKLLSSAVFGGLWQSFGIPVALAMFSAALAISMFIAILWLRATRDAQ